VFIYVCVSDLQNLLNPAVILITKSPPLQTGELAQQSTIIILY